MSPEVLFHKDHSFVSDYFALGVILFECVFGYRPYVGQSWAEIRELLLNKEIQINKDKQYSQNMIDFINSLLKTNP